MMRRARRALKTAEGTVSLLGDYAAATSRAYYAMFNAAIALLGARGIFRSKHSGVVSAFGERFAKTGDMDRELGSVFKKAFDRRLGCDYDEEHEETREMAEAALADARRFLAAAEERLKVELEGLE
jgi:uncharacterized protein (UPF0332 family)